jgi:hypothetical protein
MSVGLLRYSFNTAIFNNISTNSSFYVSPVTGIQSFNLTSGSLTLSGTVKTYYFIYGNALIMVFLFQSLTSSGSGTAQFNIQVNPPAPGAFDPILSNYNHTIPSQYEPDIGVVSYIPGTGTLTLNITATFSNITFITAVVGYDAFPSII